jgi:hypothetical protein
MIPPRGPATNFVPTPWRRARRESGELAGGFDSPSFGECENEQAEERSGVSVQRKEPMADGEPVAVKTGWTLAEQFQDRSPSLATVLAAQGPARLFKRYFKSVAAPTLADHQLIAFAKPDDYFFQNPPFSAA